MVHKTVLKVNICCDKCKKELLGAVCGIQGVNKVEADSEKGTLTVLGEADPYDIILQIRKECKFAQVVSVGPPPKPEEKKCGCPCASCTGLVCSTCKCKPSPCTCKCKPSPCSCSTCKCKPSPCSCSTCKCKPSPSPCPCSTCKCKPSPKPTPCPPCPSPCPPCPPYPSPYICPGFMCFGCVVCRPVALMDYNYQDPVPPCSIM